MSPFLLRAAIVAAAIACPAFAYAAPSADVYGNLPEVADIKITPNGQFAAMRQPVANTGGVTIYKVGGGAPCSFSPSDVKIRNIRWGNSERLLVTISFAKKEAGTQGRLREWQRLISINTSCTDPQLMLFDSPEADLQTGSSFLGYHPDGRNVLMASYGIGTSAYDASTRARRVSGVTLDVYKVDVYTGRGDVLEKGTEDTQSWLIDGTGVPRIRVDTREGTGATTVYARPSGGGSWSQVYAYGHSDRGGRGISFAGFGAESDTAYVLSRNGGDRIEAFKFNLKTGSLGEAVLRHPKVDVEGFVIDRYTMQIIGAEYSPDRSEVEYFDPFWQKTYASVSASFPNSTVTIASYTQDRKKLIAYADGPDDPGGAYYLVDLSIPQMSKIGTRYPALTPADYAPVRLLSYKARDGLEIPAYLTLPPGSNGKNLPLVVFPHGGPAARDNGDFDWWSQFMATRGYAVLQPQFRGSDGFGEKFEKAGHKKWGLEMQTDLSDGVKYLVSQGIADPNKVCITGASYGGYATMAGTTFTPDVYKCAIAVSGVSNLISMFGFLRSQYGAGFGSLDYWPELLGDPTQDAERLRATSPALHTDKVRAAVMIIHGKDDTVVPIAQSEEYARGLDKAGKPYEFIRQQGEDHWISSSSTRKQMLHEIERFLAKHLK